MNQATKFESLTGNEGKTPEQKQRIEKGEFFAVINDDHKVEHKQEYLKNSIISPEEWFARNYQGQSDDELPGVIFKDVSPETIKELRDKYSDRQTHDRQENTDKQLDMFDQKL